MDIIVAILSVLFNAVIAHSSKVLTTQIGLTVTIDCPLSNLDYNLQSIYWRRKRNETTSEYETTVYSRTTGGENIYGKHFVSDGTTSLVIPDIVESDTGSYYCRVVRQSSLRPENSEIIKLYVAAFNVSYCQNDTHHVVGGCNCYVNRSTITSLSCSVRGFPNPSTITWIWWEEDGESTKRSSSVDLTRFSDNVTLVCKAQDRNLEDVSANTSVCVYYSENEKERDAQMNIRPSEKSPSLTLAITLPVLILITIIIGIISFWAYRRKKGIPFCANHRILRWTSTPKSDRVLDELRYNTVQQGMKSVEDDLPSVDLPDKDCNTVMIFEDVPELSFPFVGQVLLDDLRSFSSEKFKKSLKGVIDRLLNKRARPYKELQIPMDASYGSMPIGALASGIQKSLKESMVADGSADRDLYFVGLVLQKLDQILDETDRDECEILITKPDFQEVTDVSQIPEYRGSKVINRSTALQSSMHSSMNRSRTSCSLELSVIREELKSMTSSERTPARNAISQIILDALGKKQRANRNLLNRSIDMLQPSEDGFRGADEVDDENSRLVALWASKVCKLDDDVNSSITEYLLPLRKPKEIENPTEETPDEPVNGTMKQKTEKHMKEPPEETINASTEGPVAPILKGQGTCAVKDTMVEPKKGPTEETVEMSDSMNQAEESWHQGQHEHDESLEDCFEK